MPVEGERRVAFDTALDVLGGQIDSTDAGCNFKRASDVATEVVGSADSVKHTLVSLVRTLFTCQRVGNLGVPAVELERCRRIAH